mgnify:FL=1|tara:strand:- start:692 stop:1885 length:1194 start_codon:yes stop_codon:yes gene_type:complete
MAKNTHLEHLEDDIFNSGTAGVTNSINFLKSLRDMLTEGDGGLAMKVTTKWDGAPAIVCGRNPQDGRFFVGTKSVFNKTSPKVVYSEADADRLYPGQTVGGILKNCLERLSTLPIQGVLQGDLLYQKKPPVIMLEGKRTYSFRPNTITYTVDVKSELGQKVGASKLGIVFHTEYTGTSMTDLMAGFGADVSKLQGKPEVAVFSSEFQNVGGAANLSKVERASVNRTILAAETNLRQGQTFIKGIQDVGKGPFTLPALFKVYFNQVVREGRVPPAQIMSKQFCSFIDKKFTTEIAKKKTGKSKVEWMKRRNEAVKYLNTNRTSMNNALDGFKNLMDAKVMIINKLTKIKSVGTFLEEENGLRATNPEGFVAIKDGAALKLVDRLEFSRANFTAAKDWG